MAIYVIGDVQGCYDELRLLLEKISYDPSQDQLWFTGDLVNRGPKSLEVLRFVSQLPQVTCVLGNHDLTLLALAYTDLAVQQHTLNSILTAPDCETLLTWLRKQPLLYCEQHYVLVHAGIPPQWTLSEAKKFANEVEVLLASDNFRSLLQNMFGNHPDQWSSDLVSWERYRFIINALTRIRFCNKEGGLDFTYKGKVTTAPTHLIPWFDFPLQDMEDKIILFGHWAALEGKVEHQQVIALDTGCYWGGCLTALRLEDNRRFSIACGGQERDPSLRSG